MTAGKPITSAFFDRPTLLVARELLGKLLCRRMEGKTLRFRITEAEAYDGPEDKACHAHRGKTARNEVMFGPAGCWYVYLCYGMHWMLNAVTGSEDYPAAVLLRGCVEAEGPGRLTKALAVDRHLDRLPITRSTGLWVESDGFDAPEAQVNRTPRIGIGYAGTEWIEKPYRFVWKKEKQSEAK